MKVATHCYLSPIQSNYSGHSSSSSKLGRVHSFRNGLLEEGLRSVERQEATPILSPISVGCWSTSRKSSSRIYATLQQHKFSSPVTSGPFVWALTEHPLHAVESSWTSNAELTSRRNRTVLGGRPRCCIGGCGSALKWGWEANVGRVRRLVRNRTTRRINGLRSFPLGLPIMRRSSLLSAEDPMVAMQDAWTITKPTASEGSVYTPFVEFAVQELRRRGDVSPLVLKEEFRNMISKDATATIRNMAFMSSKIRCFRIASIQSGSSLQVLNVAGFARPEYDVPIFCADFFSVPNRNIIVLDLNPLYNTNTNKDYKERYFTELIPLVNKYIELLPWGDKLTAESLQFFSPLVIWTKAQNKDLTLSLYPAFQDYLVTWLNMVEAASPAADAVALAQNQEAQHRYISWRATKDPGRPLLTKLCGEQLSERYIEEFLFSGLRTLGEKSFLDYFPEYRSADGSICKQRSMVGKSFEKRPWDKYGSFSPN